MRRIRIVALLWTITLLVAAGPVPCRSGTVDAAEPPASFAQVARAALAASIVVLAQEDARGATAPLSSNPAESEVDDSSARGALGAGVIVDPHGLALASARVVSRAPRLEVALLDGTILKADVVAVDLRTDVAVLRLRSHALLPHLAFADSDRVRAGDWIVAIGAPWGLGGTVTAGVITAVPTPGGSNPLASFLQTDAALGRGFVGGPLVTMSGELVGLATPLGGGGIGYALPAATVRKIYVELLEKGRVSRPWLGALTQQLSADLAREFGARTREGVLVADVLPDSPAAGAGIRSGDVIVKINGRAASSRSQLERIIGLLSPGDSIRLKVRRAARDLVLSVKLGEEPVEWEARPDLIRARRLLGIDVRPVTPATGVVVIEVDGDSPADLVGIEPGDVVREIDRKLVRNIADFQAIARRIRAGDDVLVLVQRADVAVYLIVPAR
jgi:S1-C subfamily serine protease